MRTEPIGVYTQHPEIPEAITKFLDWLVKQDIGPDDAGVWSDIDDNIVADSNSDLVKFYFKSNKV